MNINAHPSKTRSSLLLIYFLISTFTVVSAVTHSSEATPTEHVSVGTSAFQSDKRPLALSHAWIVVPTGAPQRTVLEKAGFRIAPTINRHDGQGTASVSVEFLNGFFELIYPDPTVPISPASK